MSSWIETPIAFEPKRKPATDSWWTRADVQNNREKVQQFMVANEIERANRRVSSYTHDKFPGPHKK